MILKQVEILMMTPSLIKLIIKQEIVFILSLIWPKMQKDIWISLVVFPYQNTQGNNYILLAYNFDSNGILVQLLPNCEAGSNVNCK